MDNRLVITEIDRCIVATVYGDAVPVRVELTPRRAAELASELAAAAARAMDRPAPELWAVVC